MPYCLDPSLPPPPVVVFECTCDRTVFGQSVYVVGSSKELGEWDVRRATPLITSVKEFPLWRSKVFPCYAVKPGATIEFKFFISHQKDLLNQNAVWEQTPNRVFKCPEVGQLARVTARFNSNEGISITISTVEAPSDQSVQADDLDLHEPVMEHTASSSMLLPSHSVEPIDPTAPVLGEAVTPSIDVVITPSAAGRFFILDYFAELEAQAGKLPSLPMPITFEIHRTACSGFQRCHPSISSNFAVSNQNKTLRKRLLAIRGDLAHWLGELQASIFQRSACPSAAVGVAHAYLYWTWVANGTIKCVEDGGHHRPSQTAAAAKGIVDLFEASLHSLNVLQTTAHHWEIDLIWSFARRILPTLPSFKPQFTTAEPLTRIRDIAHRNDIPQDLKREIKTTLQNKLHRCAGPEDLVTATKLLDRFMSAPHNYPSGFLNEFRTFHGELREFFNAENLGERIGKLPHDIPTSGFFQAKGRHAELRPDDVSNNVGVILDLMKEVTNLRMQLLKKIHAHQTENGLYPDNPSLGQDLRIGEIKLEEFLFTLASQVATAAENTKPDRSARDPRSLTVVKHLLMGMKEVFRNLALSNWMSVSSALIAQEISNLLGQAERNQASGMCQSIARRAIRIGKILSDLVSSLLPPASTQQFAGSLKISQPHVGAMAGEGFIRSSLIFQLSRLGSSLLKHTDDSGSEFISLSESKPEVGFCIAVEDLSDEAKIAERLKGLTLNRSLRDPGGPPITQLIFLITSATGDEELEGLGQRLATMLAEIFPHGRFSLQGVLLAHTIPVLSHLGVRARQQKIGFCCVRNSEIFKWKEFASHWSGKFALFDAMDDAPLQLPPATWPEHPASEDQPPTNGSFVTAPHLPTIDENVTPSDGQITADGSDSPYVPAVDVNSNPQGGEGCRTVTLNIPQAIRQPPAAANDFHIITDPKQMELENCGAKCYNCVQMALKVSGFFQVPTTVALPFGAMEAAFNFTVNEIAGQGIQKTIARLDTAPDSDLPELCDSLERSILEELGLSIHGQELLQEGLVKMISDVGNALSQKLLLCVRSSSNVEDLKELPAAGLYESLICDITREIDNGSPKNVGRGTGPFSRTIDVRRLWVAIKTVWASLYSLRAVQARRAAKIPTSKARMAVVIQPIVPTTWSFIAHTVCPPSLLRRGGTHSKNSSDYICVELAKGLGEALASGGTAVGGGSPMRLLIDHTTGKYICDAPFDFLGAISKNGQVVFTSLTASEMTSVFWDKISAKLRLLKRLEDVFGDPQDVEGCIVVDENTGDLHVHLVQSRPQA